ncbi:MAG: hypothetical protein ACKO85_09145 [Isosphaeraceae bacterium]
MNRRDALRTGLGSALAHQLAGLTFADDAAVLQNHSPTEKPPIVAAAEAAQPLSELLAGKLVEAGWALIESNRVRLTLKNISEKRLSILVDPGTVLRHEKNAWLVGGPSRYAGQFGGLFGPTSMDAEAVPNTIPLGAGKSAALSLPVVELMQPEQGKFKELAALKMEKAGDWTKDAPTAALLTALAGLGTSLGVAQGIAWKISGLELEKITQQRVESQTLTEFDRFSIERFSEIFKTIPDQANLQTISTALNLEKLHVQVLATGVRRQPAQKLLAGILARQSFMGLPVGGIALSATEAAPKWASLKLDFQVVNEIRAGLYAVDASLASRTGLNGLFVKFARVRLPLRPDTQGAELLAWLEGQMAPSMARLVRTGQGGMTSRFRLENQTTQTLAMIETTTGGDSSDQALFELAGLGVGPRARASVRIPAVTARATRIRFASI